jgi:uncharacterized membrane protein (DUF106 family)
VIPEVIHLLNLLGLLVPPPTNVSFSPTPVYWDKIFLVIGMSVGVNLLYAVGRLKLTDVDKMRRYTQELKAFRSEMTQAMREGDKQKQDKMKKKQQQMNKMQMEMSKEQMKPTFLFMIPLFGLYYLVSGYMNCNSLTFICSHSVPLITVPIYIPYIFAGTVISGALIAVMPFWVWYFVCSFTFSTLINRIFGLTFDY